MALASAVKKLRARPKSSCQGCGMAWGLSWEIRACVPSPAPLYPSDHTLAHLEQSRQPPRELRHSFIPKAPQRNSSSRSVQHGACLITQCQLACRVGWWCRIVRDVHSHALGYIVQRHQLKGGPTAAPASSPSGRSLVGVDVSGVPCHIDVCCSAPASMLLPASCPASRGTPCTNCPTHTSLASSTSGGLCSTTIRSPQQAPQRRRCQRL